MLRVLQKIPLPIDLLHDTSATPDCKVKRVRCRRNTPKQWYCNSHGQLLLQPTTACLFCSNNLHIEN